MRFTGKLIDTLRMTQNLAVKAYQYKVAWLNSSPQDTVWQRQKRILIIECQAQMIIIPFPNALVEERSIAQPQIFSQFRLFLAHGVMT